MATTFVSLAALYCSPVAFYSVCRIQRICGEGLGDDTKYNLSHKPVLREQSHSMNCWQGNLTTGTQKSHLLNGTRPRCDLGR